MNKVRPRFRLLWVELALALVAVGIALLARYSFPLTQFMAENTEARFIDARFLVRGEWSPEAIDRAAEKAVIVAVDDAATNRLGRVVPREVHAQMVRQLQRAGARAVIFDIVFADPSRDNPAADLEFASAIAEAGNVFLPFDHNASRPAPAAVQKAIQQKLAYPLPLPEAGQGRIQPPVEPLFQAMQGGGHVMAQADADRVFRSALLLYVADAPYPHIILDAVARRVWGLDLGKPDSMSLQDGFLQFDSYRVGPLEARRLWRSAYDSSGQRVVRESSGEGWMVSLDFPGGTDVMREMTVPYLDVLEGRTDERIRDRVVIIGETATGTTDLRPSPFDRDEVMRGVETNATLLINLLEDRFLRHAPLNWAIMATLLCGLIAGFSVVVFRPGIAFLLALSTLSAYGFLAFVVFALDNLILEMTAPLGAVFWCFTVMLGYRLLVIDRAARRYEAELDEVETMLGQYVDSDIVHELRDNPERRLAMQIGTRRDVTILFSDIRDFTAWCETQPPEEVKARLDEYMPLMCEIAHDDYGGFIDKFIGDELMVVWNTIYDQPDHAERAVRTALSMQRGLQLLNEGWRKQKQQEFRIGIGIATGRAVFGTFGSPRHKLMATVLGDRVNLASRLETMTKETGSPIIISHETYEAVADKFEFKPLGTIPVRGKSEAQPVYEVLGIKAKE